MKNSYVVITIKENDKLYSYLKIIPVCNNLISELKIKNIVNAFICETKKQAIEIVKSYNDSYKNNGSYMFDYPTF